MTDETLEAGNLYSFGNGNLGILIHSEDARAGSWRIVYVSQNRSDDVESFTPGDIRTTKQLLGTIQRHDWELLANLQDALIRIPQLIEEGDSNA